MPLRLRNECTFHQKANNLSSNLLAELGYGQIINYLLSLPWQSSIPQKEYIPTFFPSIAGRADENPSKSEN